jgi:hypothetical protein
MQERFFVKTEISIGELSRRTGCKVETVRYYERIGLLPKARREGGRFRRYDANDVFMSASMASLLQFNPAHGLRAPPVPSLQGAPAKPAGSPYEGLRSTAD